MSTNTPTKTNQTFVGVRRTETGVRRFDARLLRILLLGLVAVLVIHIWNSCSAKTYLGEAIRQRRPMLVLTGIQQAFIELNTSAKNVVGVERAPQTSQLPTIRLDVPKNTLVKMQKAYETGVPELGHDEGGTKPYYKGTFSCYDPDGVARKLHRCKICLRGSMPWHHDFAKPSLRIKIKKADHTGGARYIELTRPEDALAMKNWLPAKMGAELGLITEGIDHVRLFMNNKFMGVYLRSMRQDEPMALSYDRMPGTFFKGDFGGNLWDSTEHWKMGGDELPEDLLVFEKFIGLLEQPMTRTKIESIKQHLDFEQYARWAALMVVTGSLHTDHVHNHSYFYSGVRGTIEPIPWDCNSFGIHSQVDSPVDAAQHPVMLALMADPAWVHRRNEIIHQMISKDYTVEKLTKIIKKVEAFNR